MNQNNPEEVLLAVVNKVLEFSGEGKQAKAQHILPFVYESVMQYPQLLWDNKEIWKIAKALLVMHHYDMIDDEDEEIKMLQKVSLAVSCGCASTFTPFSNKVSTVDGL